MNGQDGKLYYMYFGTAPKIQKFLLVYVWYKAYTNTDMSTL